MVQQNCEEEITNSKNPLQDGSTPRGVKISEENFSANRKSLNRLKWDDAEARADFWSIQGDFIYRRHNEPRVGSAHTDLNVMQQERIDDYWKVDLKRSLSDS